jgi:hypothetical protein
MNSKPVKKFPVRLKFGYYPADPDHPRHPTVVGQSEKVPAGSVIELPLEEARQLIADGKAERADQIPIE